ncbi:MAG: MerR family transcriptional regulator [Planctomycetes bacterium]|nr:MerR family transcriptional regulator [Planctomycetota bacterium]
MQSVRIWKIGKLAVQAGISVRTLHYYDEIGLLPPSHRTGAGHRLYTEDDVRRLQCIKSLCALGFSLDQTGGLLSTRDCSPRQVIEMHLTQLREEMRRQLKLVERLEAIHEKLQHEKTAGIDELLGLITEIEMMETFKKCYTAEQLDTLEKRAQKVGPERMQEVQGEWHELIGQVREQMNAGSKPDEPQVQELAKRWMGLIDEFTGGQKDIAESLGNVYKYDPTIASSRGFDLDATIMEYVAKSWASLNTRKE